MAIKSSSPVFFIADTEADMSAGIFPDGAYVQCLDTHKVYSIENGTAKYLASSGGGAAWGDLTGTLSNQIDLSNALALKATFLSPNLVTPVLGAATATTINGATITSGTLNGTVTGTNTGDQTLAGLGGIAHSLATAVNDFLVASGSGVFVKQTLAQVKTLLGLTGTNSGDQTSIAGITGTIAQFNTAITDGDMATGGGTATGANTGDNAVNSNYSGLVTNATHTGDATGATALTIAVSYAGSQCLTSNFTTSSVTAVSTNLTFAIAAGAVYDVDVYGTCSKATSATGLKFAILCPASCVIKGYQNGGGATLAAPLVPSLISAINTLGTALATGIGVEVAFELHFRVVNSINAGSITIQAATVTSNVATVTAGTKMSWRKSVQV